MMCISWWRGESSSSAASRSRLKRDFWATRTRTAALGDIGKLFPDNDPAFAGADSVELLKNVCAVIADAGYRVGNVDCTVIAQRPKLAPFIPDMRQKLAKAMEVDVTAVSVKATTEEHLGFTGEGLGIAAHSVALLEEK